MAIGGEDGEFARVSLAEGLFELGRDADALAQLDALKGLPPSSPGPCQIAGELLEARARTELALVWFDLAVSLLTAEERSAMRSAGASGMYGKMIVAGRRRMRRKLGLPNDEMDKAVPPPWFPGDEAFVSTDELLEIPGRIPARQVRSLFWQVREFGEAVRRWPAIFSSNGPDHRGRAGCWRQGARCRGDWGYCSPLWAATGTPSERR